MSNQLLQKICGVKVHRTNFFRESLGKFRQDILLNPQNLPAPTPMPTVYYLRSSPAAVWPHAAFDNEICGRPHVIKNIRLGGRAGVHGSKTNARQENQSTKLFF